MLETYLLGTLVTFLFSRYVVNRYLPEEDRMPIIAGIILCIVSWYGLLVAIIAFLFLKFYRTIDFTNLEYWFQNIKD